jgi:hypothetical protein
MSVNHLDPVPHQLDRTVPFRAQERPTPIADYGLLGDTRTAALVSSAGSVDWLCAPAFDGEPSLVPCWEDRRRADSSQGRQGPPP